MQEVTYANTPPSINPLEKEPSFLGELVSSLFTEYCSPCFEGEQPAYSLLTPLDTGISLMERLKLKVCGWETNNPDFMLKALAVYGPEAMKECAPKLRANPDFVLKAIDIVGCEAIKHINKGLQSNPDFILRVINEKDIKVLKYASPSLLNDPAFMLDVINEVTKAAKNEEELDEHLAFIHQTAGKNLQKATSGAFRCFQRDF